MVCSAMYGLHELFASVLPSVQLLSVLSRTDEHSAAVLVFRRLIAISSPGKTTLKACYCPRPLQQPYPPESGD